MRTVLRCRLVRDWCPIPPRGLYRALWSVMPRHLSRNEPRAAHQRRADWPVATIGRYLPARSSHPANAIGQVPAIGAEVPVIRDLWFGCVRYAVTRLTLVHNLVGHRLGSDGLSGLSAIISPQVAGGDRKTSLGFWSAKCRSQRRAGVSGLCVGKYLPTWALSKPTKPGFVSFGSANVGVHAPTFFNSGNRSSHPMIGSQGIDGIRSRWPAAHLSCRNLRFGNPSILTKHG